MVSFDRRQRIEDDDRRRFVSTASQLDRPAARGVSRHHVGDPISNHERSTEIELVIGRRRPEKARARFATLAFHPVRGDGRLGMVGADVPGVERGTTRLVNQPIDMRVDGGDVVERRVTARDHRLVGDGDQDKARVTKASQSVGHIELKPYLVRFGEQVHVLNQHPVPIEEDCGS